MPSFAKVASLALATTSLFATSALAAVDPIVIKGSKFFHKNNGTQFFIKGVAYQRDYDKDSQSSATSGTTYVDSLASKDSCNRDIKYLKQLQTNTIRVYAIDPSADHDDCMSAFANAGIYVIADMSAPVDGQSIVSDSPSWDLSLYKRYTSVIDSLAKYDNVLGFFAGNEVANSPNQTNSIAFVKAAVRDTKKYIKDKSYRPMGVGYASTDGSKFYLEAAHYLACGSSDTSIDFFGYNIYSWCGQSDPTSSSYEKHTKEFADYPVPAFFAEYGCVTEGTRTWDDTKYLYGPEMSKVWSGGIAYEYFPAQRGYGLVQISGNSVTTTKDFDNLKSVISQVSPSGVDMNSYSATNPLSTCPSASANFAAAASPLPPSPNSQVCDCMTKSLSCVVKDGVDSKDYGKLFASVCGLDKTACAGIAHNGTTGSYGAYSPCDPKSQLSYAFDKYYQNRNKAASACDFGGNANVVSGSKSDQCSSVLNSVGNPDASNSGGSSGSGDKKSAAIRSQVSGLALSMVLVALVSGIFAL